MVREWPFAGRTAQLDHLADLVLAGSSLLLVGEPGVGKSALAGRVAERLAGTGMRVGAISGPALAEGVPYEPFAGLLTRAGGWPVGSEPTPRGVADQVTQALTASDAGSRPAPLLVVADDVHLLDDPSVLVLCHLIADGAARILLTTSAPGEVPVTVHRLVHDGRCREVEVPALPDAELAEVLELALGGPVEQRTERAFLRRSAGNPLLLRELVSAALDSGALARVDGLWLVAGEAPLARSVTDLLGDRVRELSGRERAALELVAATEPLPLGVGIALSGWPVIEELEAARLLAVRDDLGSSTLVSAHPLVGDTIRAGLPRLRLRRLRLTVAAVLEAAPAASPQDLMRAALWRLDGGERGDPESLLAAARAARGVSTEWAERLARAALASGATVEATVLLSQILTNDRRVEEARALVADLPPESLPDELRDALVYLRAIGDGLLVGDAAGAAELVAGALAGEAAASQRLRAVYSSFLAFDARFAEALAVGTEVADDDQADAASRTFAGLGVVGAHYWLGQRSLAVASAERLRASAERVREELPYGAPSLEVLAISAELEAGDLDRARDRAMRMAGSAGERDDPYALPRAEYLQARMLLAAGRPRAAARLFRRCLAAFTPFDQTFAGLLRGWVARSEALAGDVAAARAALDLTGLPSLVPPYEPEHALARAAVLAAELDLAQAGDLAAYTASVTAARSQWITALHAGHDAARYGAARAVRDTVLDAARQVDGPLPGLIVDHVEALCAGDGAALDRAATAFAAAGRLALAVEAAASAALAHNDQGARRAAHASAATAARLRARTEPLHLPWLDSPDSPEPLTPREREVARFAAAGWSDAAIATHLGISIRTVQTHLARVYDKVGVRGRTELAKAAAGD